MFYIFAIEKKREKKKKKKDVLSPIPLAFSKPTPLRFLAPFPTMTDCISLTEFVHADSGTLSDARTHARTHALTHSEILLDNVSF